MSGEIEMEEFSNRPKPAIVDDKPGGRLNQPEDTQQEGSVTLWAYAATVILLLLAIPMIFFPNFLLYISESSSERRNALTPLELYLSLNSGIVLATLAIALLFNAPAGIAVQLPSANNASHPLLTSTTLATSIIALLSYNTTSVGALAFFVFLGSAIIAAWGWWAILFSGTSYISRKTGADKRTSAFIFGNKAAASSRKKEWKKGQLQ
ncbi:hypothetical protein BDY19DRAFT_902436 [Irpex rosettiformis]|uniref:Uncharacterized protein n=1 Tax=Irpex rosettiformis TaxID=378272 RepID=A0ACB8UHM8_9APHY|nr:hypothetical protein BDY19DRAFT_902436 [Irpex rosettiformis]